MINKKVKELLSKKEITSVEPAEGQFLSTLFLVSKKHGNHRSVINLTHLNQFLQYQHFHMENL